MTKPPFVSHAQNGEDVMLWRALRHVGRGFYLDVGAAEPDADSVTRAFYERGWHGINLEPSPGAFARLDRARPRDMNLQVAAGATPGEADFLLVDGGNGLSTLRTETRDALAATWPIETVRVAVRRLGDICAEQVRGVIHFLKIDAEGAEREVLEGADLAVWRPWIVLVEATEVNSQVPAHAKWEDLLLAQRYRMVYADGLNRFYLSDDHADLAAAFAVPPNVFDNVLRYSELAAREDAAAQRQELQALRGQLADLRSAHQTADAAAQAALAEGAAVRADLQDSQAQHAAAEAREATLRAECAFATQELWEANRLTGVLASDRQKLLDAQATQQQAREAAQDDRLAAVYASTSWRITAPVRALARLGGRP